ELTVPEGDGILHVAPPERMVTVNYPRHYVQFGDKSAVKMDPVRFRALPDIRGRVTAEAGVRLDKVLIASRNLDPPVYVV
ncbi:MAG: hypothetical protein GWN53_09345, partial [Gammaproteobacteria bacterium]|nr:hypothetical protein [Gammaproteobacteria bacterium]